MALADVDYGDFVCMHFWSVYPHAHRPHSAGTTSIICVFFLRETYGPYILARLEGKSHAPAKLGFIHAFTRPVRMLLFAPIATAMAGYISIVYGILYLHIVTIPLLFGPESVAGLFTYGWQNGNEGLAYLGIGKRFSWA